MFDSIGTCKCTHLDDGSRDGLLEGSRDGLEIPKFCSQRFVTTPLYPSTLMVTKSVLTSMMDHGLA
jgi:hypothetical protein